MLKFLSAEPAGFVDGPNLYAYVKQNPWTAWDPDGLKLNMPQLKSEEGLSGDELKSVQGYNYQVNSLNRRVAAVNKLSPTSTALYEMANSEKMAHVNINVVFTNEQLSNAKFGENPNEVIVNINTETMRNETFGHELQHAITFGLTGKFQGRGTKNELEMRYKNERKNADAVVTVSNSRDDPNDAKENEATRVSNIIIAKLFINRNMPPENKKSHDPAKVANNSLVKGQLIYQHQNNKSAIPLGTYYGDHDWETLRQSWK
jgi:hypothetical protein